VIVIDTGPPFRFKPRFERAGVMVWRVQWLWWAVARIEGMNLSQFTERVHAMSDSGSPRYLPGNT
jgi:hypothetical protein